MFTFLLAAASTWTWWIEPCTDPRSACKPGDADLAAWALEAWSRASGGLLKFDRVQKDKAARIRFYWAAGRTGLYGEARPILMHGKRGAEIFLRPDLRALGQNIASAGAADALFRETIVYLTCLHESGHALGLTHTSELEDIMYSFTFGGDFVGYFQRYRQKLSLRGDIPKHGGYSGADAARLQRLLANANAF